MSKIEHVFNYYICTVVNILFICIENSNRSQMAQAFAIIHGSDIVNAHSAGANPSGIINPKAIEAMQKVGYDLTTHNSKSSHDFDDLNFNYVVSMGCGDACPWVLANHRIEWDIPDPRNMNEIDFLGVRNLIENKVKELLQIIRSA